MPFPQNVLLVTLSSLVLLLLVVVPSVDARKHHLSVHGDSRRFFPISTFGFFTGGFLAVNVTGFHYVEEKSGENNEAAGSNDTDPPSAPILGFSIDKTTNDALNPYLETSEARCILGPQKPPPNVEPAQDAILRFNLKFDEGKTEVECSSNIKSINIFSSRDRLQDILAKNAAADDKFSDSAMFSSIKQAAGPSESRVKRQMQPPQPPAAAGAPLAPPSSGQDNGCKAVDIKLHSEISPDGATRVFNTSFVIYIANEKEEGLYSLYFHNCHNYERDSTSKVRVDFTVDIEEKNNNSYLSAGEMPLPALYLLMAVLFFLSGCFWVFILRKNGTEQVYRIHWVMAALVYLKSLSLFFHGINYHKIETNGYHIETWAVLYYITHLLKGGLLFFTIVLIGSGWAFVKHILSDKEKRVFIIVLPLQILANVAYIIIEESEEGDANHNWWKEVFILVDLLCCGAILFPVVWSIRHLQDASQTDGKATVSLEKLKLFRVFYIMVVSYIYFTRIIVYLLKITVPFQYEWLDEMFKEMATFVFFVMTGYKFRPASNNPYFNVPTDEYEMDEEVLIGGTAINEQVTNRKKRVFVDDDDSEDDEAGMVFFPQETNHKTSRGAESSHDLG